MILKAGSYINNMHFRITQTTSTYNSGFMQIAGVIWNYSEFWATRPAGIYLLKVNNRKTMAGWETLVLNGTKYSRMDQEKVVEDSL